MKALVVFSGGMDSATAIVWALNNGFTEIETVSFNYGSKHNDKEYEHALKFCERYGIKNTRIDLAFINQYFKSDLLKSGDEIPEGHYADPSMQKTVVPFRNGIMLSIAVGLAESKEMTHVIIGNHSGDHAIYPDCRSEFIEGMALAASVGTYKAIKIHSPFCSVDKTAIVKLGAQLSVPYELTYSCYNGGEKHCGKCGTCHERKESFELAGVIDSTEYLA